MICGATFINVSYSYYKYLHPVFEECIWSQFKCPSQVVPRCRCLSSFDANKIAINFFPSFLLVGRQMSPGRSEARRGVHSRWPSSAAAGTNKSPHDQTCRRCLMMEWNGVKHICRNINVPISDRDNLYKHWCLISSLKLCWVLYSQLRTLPNIAYMSGHECRHGWRLEVRSRGQWTLLRC